MGLFVVRRPHLLEVNTIPSLFINAVSKDVDTRVKAPMLAGIKRVNIGHKTRSL
jgi:hypothetical protein